MTDVLRFILRPLGDLLWAAIVRGLVSFNDFLELFFLYRVTKSATGFQQRIPTLPPPPLYDTPLSVTSPDNVGLVRRRFICFLNRILKKYI